MPVGKVFWVDVEHLKLKIQHYVCSNEIAYHEDMSYIPNVMVVKDILSKYLNNNTWYG